MSSAPPLMADDGSFIWTPKRVAVANDLAEGFTCEETAERTGVSLRSIARLRKNYLFAAEVQRLTLMTGVAVRAERLKIAKRVIRQKVAQEINKITGQKNPILTRKDLLDWLQYSQSETDGVKLDLTDILSKLVAAAPVDAPGDGPELADSEPAGSDPSDTGEGEA